MSPPCFCYENNRFDNSEKCSIVPIVHLEGPKRKRPPVIGRHVNSQL